MTFMADEIAQCPDAAARLLASPATDAIARALRARSFSFVVVCGRGSSGHAGVYLRYLIETHLAYVVSASAPSIITSYRKAPSVEGALFMVISQSGRSPDLVRDACVAGALRLQHVGRLAHPFVPFFSSPGRM